MPRKHRKPRLAVWKFSSCDGCQLSLLNCESELLALGEQIEIAYFPEALSRPVRGRYDLSLVDGSISTAHDEQRIRALRRRPHRVPREPARPDLVAQLPGRRLERQLE